MATTIWLHVCESSLQRALTTLFEVAFGANIEADVELLQLGGPIASYATDNACEAFGNSETDHY